MNFPELVIASAIKENKVSVEFVDLIKFYIDKIPSTETEIIRHLGAAFMEADTLHRIPALAKFLRETQ